MASLKEIKLRINSVQSTQKITSAMKMVSSAKLHHFQAEVEHTLLYSEKLTGILNGLLADSDDLNTPFAEQRKVSSVALVVFSSSNGLCGSYNANVWKELLNMIRRYEAEKISVRLVPVGKKVADELQHAGYEIDDRFVHAAEKPSYAQAVEMAEGLINLFISHTVDKVEFLYHHFKNTATQTLTTKVFLPVVVENNTNGAVVEDYLFEPSIEYLQQILFPKLLKLTVYTVMFDTITAEHAARMMAMQVANDNANDLIQQLTLQYNKNRQQVITNELLDIMGGSMK